MRAEHLEEYVLAQPEEEHIDSVKDEHQVEIVDLSDNEFAVDNDDIKDEYENEAHEEHDANTEEYDMQEKSILEEHDFECYECQLTFSKCIYFLSLKLK